MASATTSSCCGVAVGSTAFDTRSEPALLLLLTEAAVEPLLLVRESDAGFPDLLILRVARNAPSSGVGKPLFGLRFSQLMSYEVGDNLGHGLDDVEEPPAFVHYT